MVHGLLDSLALTPAERQKQTEKHQNFIKKLQEIKKENDNGIPAKLRPKKSDFGWVFFNDEPSMPKTNPIEIPTTTEIQDTLAPTPNATELIPVTPITPSPKRHKKTKLVKQKTSEAPIEKQISQPIIEQPEHIAQKLSAPIEKIAAPPTTQLIEKQLVARPQCFVQQNVSKGKPLTEKQLKKELKKKDAANELNIESLMDEINTAPEAEQTIDEQTEAPINDVLETPEPSADIQARIDRIAHMQEQVERFAPSSDKPTTKVRGAKSIKPKDGRGIIALTKGFVENIKDEGEDDIERDGDPNKRPSFEEMKYISYEANINWNWQATWKQNFRYNPTIRTNGGKAIIEFTIDEKGYITQLELLQSSGDKELDNIIMKNTKFASPFPPLPKHFGVKSYTTGRRVNIY